MQLLLFFSFFLSVYSLAVEPRACISSDVAIVNQQASDPHYFCNWFLSDGRTNSPIPKIGANALLNACRCITSTESTATKQKISTQIAQAARLQSFVSAKCSSASANPINKQFKTPSLFCSFFASFERHDSPIPNLNVPAVRKACQCVLTATSSSTKVLSASKTSSTSKKTTSKSSLSTAKSSSKASSGVVSKSSSKVSSSKASVVKTSSSKISISSKTSSTKISTSTRASSSKVSTSTKLSSTRISSSSLSSAKVSTSSSKSSSSRTSSSQSSSKTATSSSTSSIRGSASSTLYTSSSSSTAPSTSTTSSTSSPLSTSSSATPTSTADAYDVITSQHLEEFCTAWLDYPTPSATVYVTAYATLTQTDISTETTTSTFVTLTTETDIVATTFVTSTVSTSASQVLRRRVAVPSVMYAYGEDAIISACGRVVSRPATQTVSQTFSATVVEIASTTETATAYETDVSTVTELATSTSTSFVTPTPVPCGDQPYGAVFTVNSRFPTRSVDYNLYCGYTLTGPLLFSVAGSGVTLQLCLENCNANVARCAGAYYVNSRCYGLSLVTGQVLTPGGSAAMVIRN